MGRVWRSPALTGIVIPRLGSRGEQSLKLRSPALTGIVLPRLGSRGEQSLKLRRLR
ncbi:MAG: hypothetical protein ABW035_09220 [Acidimicrobiales bacterium]